jgi:hypothetical protein
MNDLHRVEFRVYPSPETNDFEVRVFVDDEDFLRKHWPEMIGMDPYDILSHDVLAPGNTPRGVMIARCSCGVWGCGNVSAQISQEGDTVLWDAWMEDTEASTSGRLQFDKKLYLQAVERAIEDKSWESPDRTAARLLSTILDSEMLAANGLSFQWASGRIRKDAFTVSLGHPPDCHQILVHTSWKRETPEEIAELAARVLKKQPFEWSDVQWFGQGAMPPFHGPGWHR